MFLCGGFSFDSARPQEIWCFVLTVLAARGAMIVASNPCQTRASRELGFSLHVRRDGQDGRDAWGAVRLITTCLFSETGTHCSATVIKPGRMESQSSCLPLGTCLSVSLSVCDASHIGPATVPRYLAHCRPQALVVRRDVLISDVGNRIAVEWLRNLVGISQTL